MANVNVRVADELVARFDAWAGARGGRSPALRALMAEAVAGASDGVAEQPLGPRPLKLTVRLRADDGVGLEAAAAAMGLTPNAWVAALVRRRLAGGPTYSRDGDLALIGMRGELRRIGVNINQIARALNTAVLEGRVLDAELSDVAALRRETREHVVAIGDALAGNLAYWSVAS